MTTNNVSKAFKISFEKEKILFGNKRLIKMEELKNIPVPNSAPKKMRSKASSSNSVDKPKRPKYSEMITAAVKALRERSGASRQAITKYVRTNYDVPVTFSRSISSNLKSMIENKNLVLTKGVGAAGRYKLNKAVGVKAKRSVKRGKKRTVKRTRKSPKKKRVSKARRKRSRKSPVKKRSAKKTTKKPGRKTVKKLTKKPKK